MKKTLTAAEVERTELTAQIAEELSSYAIRRDVKLRVVEQGFADVTAATKRKYVTRHHPVCC